VRHMMSESARLSCTRHFCSFNACACSSNGVVETEACATLDEYRTNALQFILHSRIQVNVASRALTQRPCKRPCEHTGKFDFQTYHPSRDESRFVTHTQPLNDTNNSNINTAVINEKGSCEAYTDRRGTATINAVSTNPPIQQPLFSLVFS